MLSALCFFFYRQLWNLTAQFFKFVFPYNICPWKKKACFMFMVNIRRLKAVGELMKQSTCPNNVKTRLNQINLIMIMTTWTTRTSGTKMSVWCDICSFYPMQFVTEEDNQCSAWDALKRPSKKTSMLEFFFSLVLPSFDTDPKEHRVHWLPPWTLCHVQCCWAPAANHVDKWGKSMARLQGAILILFTGQMDSERYVFYQHLAGV